MHSLNPNYFVHAANILLVVAYSVRDILWHAFESSTCLLSHLWAYERGAKSPNETEIASIG
jgi:hypothetical protein